MAHAWPAVAICQRLKITSAARKACVSTPWALPARVACAHLNATRVSGVRRACGTPRLSSKSSAARDVRCERRTRGVTARRGAARQGGPRTVGHAAGRVVAKCAQQLVLFGGELRRGGSAAEKRHHGRKVLYLKQVAGTISMELGVRPRQRGAAGAPAARRAKPSRASARASSLLGRRLAWAGFCQMRPCPRREPAHARGAKPAPRDGRAPAPRQRCGRAGHILSRARTSQGPTACRRLAQGEEHHQEARPRQGRKSRCFTRGTAARRVRPSTPRSCAHPDSKKALRLCVRRPARSRDAPLRKARHVSATACSGRLRITAAGSAREARPGSSPGERKMARLRTPRHTRCARGAALVRKQHRVEGASAAAQNGSISGRPKYDQVHVSRGARRAPAHVCSCADGVP